MRRAAPKSGMILFWVSALVYIGIVYYGAGYPCVIMFARRLLPDAIHAGAPMWCISS